MAHQSSLYKYIYLSIKASPFLFNKWGRTNNKAFFSVWKQKKTLFSKKKIAWNLSRQTFSLPRLQKEAKCQQVWKRRYFKVADRWADTTSPCCSKGINTQQAADQSYWEKMLRNIMEHPTSVPVLIDNQRSHSGLASTTLCQTASERGRWTRRIMQTTNDGMWHRSVLSACDRIMFSFFISGIKISQNANHLAKHKLFFPVVLFKGTHTGFIVTAHRWPS